MAEWRTFVHDGGFVLVALVQKPPTFEPPSQDDSFGDIIDVAGVAIALTFVVLLIAVCWPALKRWARHRIRRRRRRRHHHDAHHGASSSS